MKQATLTILASLIAMSAHGAALNMVETKKLLDNRTRALIEQYEPSAATGDYQAMRNLGYAWSTDPKKIPAAASIGCAWYAAIMEVHHGKTQAGDESNQRLYCGRLTADQARQAAYLSIKIQNEIAAK